MSRVVKKLLVFVRALDWVDRSEYIHRLHRVNPDLANDLIDQLGPDEFLWGRNMPMKIKGAIPLPDGPRGQKRPTQATLERFGFRKRR